MERQTFDLSHMEKYLVIVEKAPSNFSAYSPDVPGCVATGKTIDETLREMKEALEFQRCNKLPLFHY